MIDYPVWHYGLPRACPRNTGHVARSEMHSVYQDVYFWTTAKDDAIETGYQNITFKYLKDTRSSFTFTQRLAPVVGGM